MRHAKIVATFGPATAGYEMTRQLIEAGVDVARVVEGKKRVEQVNMTTAYGFRGMSNRIARQSFESRKGRVIAGKIKE